MYTAPASAPELATERLILRMGTPDDIPAIVGFFSVNREFLKPFEPIVAIRSAKRWIFWGAVEARGRSHRSRPDPGLVRAWTGAIGRGSVPAERCDQALEDPVGSKPA